MPEASPGVSGAAEMSVQSLERMLDRLGDNAYAATVFGAPVTVDAVTVIPVARAGFGFGGGLGRESGADKIGEGGGGGGGMDVRPLGFIEMRDGVARYRPIRDPWVDVVVPLAAIAAGLGAPRLFRAALRLRRTRRRRGPVSMPGRAPVRRMQRRGGVRPGAIRAFRRGGESLGDHGR